MPIAVTYPGVYIQEAPSGDRMIAQVATGVTAFVGRTKRGPVSEPVRVFTWSDFVRVFGELEPGFPLGYAVSDFFANGGAEAVIARLHEPATDDGVARLHFMGAAGAPLVLCAASPGAWGNRLSATIDTDDITNVTAAQFDAPYGLGATDLFNLTLTLREAGGGTTVERFLNLSFRRDGRAGSFPKQVDRVLATESVLARVERMPDQSPTGSATGEGGNDGAPLDDTAYLGDAARRSGMYALERVAGFNLLIIAPDDGGDLSPTIHHAAATLCADRRAIYLVDPPLAWTQRLPTALDRDALLIHGTSESGIPIDRNAVIYFPAVWRHGSLAGDAPARFSSSGAVAGLIAATDAAHGVWKAPAGPSATLTGVARLDVDLSDEATTRLTRLGINCLRTLPGLGTVVWGQRTVRGADQFEDDHKFLSVRRLTLFIEESVSQGIRWAVFEPNDETLWSSLRLAVGTFMADLQRQGAVLAYAVTCDASTTTVDDIERGVVNLVLQFAPIEPGKFLVLSFQQQVAAAP